MKSFTFSVWLRIFEKTRIQALCVKIVRYNYTMSAVDESTVNGILYNKYDVLQDQTNNTKKYIIVKIIKVGFGQPDKFMVNEGDRASIDTNTKTWTSEEVAKYTNLSVKNRGGKKRATKKSRHSKKKSRRSAKKSKKSKKSKKTKSNKSKRT